MWILSPAGKAVLSHKPVYLKDLKGAANRNPRSAKLMWKGKGFWAQRAASCRFWMGCFVVPLRVCSKVRSWQRLMLCLETFTEVGGFDGQGFNMKEMDIMTIYDISGQAMSNSFLDSGSAQTWIWFGVLANCYTKTILKYTSTGMHCNMNIFNNDGRIRVQDFLICDFLLRSVFTHLYRYLESPARSERKIAFGKCKKIQTVHGASRGMWRLANQVLVSGKNCCNQRQAIVVLALKAIWAICKSYQKFQAMESRWVNGDPEIQILCFMEVLAASPFGPLLLDGFRELWLQRVLYTCSHSQMFWAQGGTQNCDAS